MLSILSFRPHSSLHTFSGNGRQQRGLLRVFGLTERPMWLFQKTEKSTEARKRVQ